MSSASPWRAGAAALAFACAGLPAQAQLAPTLALPPSGASHGSVADGCGTPTPSRSVLDAVQARLAGHGEVERLPGGDFPPLIIPAVYHVITAEDGMGAATEQQILDQHDAINAGLMPWGIEMVFLSWQTVPNDDWYGVATISGSQDNAAALEMKTTLAVDPTTTLNLYFTDLGTSLKGYAQFPDTWPENSPRWGVVMDGSTLPGTGDPFGGGNVGTHEVGHALGLYHTFQDGCHADSQCEVAGDRVCDTPAEASPNGFEQACGNLRDSCPTAAGNDPVENYMDYSSPECMIEFTEGQAERMHTMLSTFKPTLYDASRVSSVYVGPGALDFGSGFVGFPRTQQVSLINVTEAPLTITSVEAPAGFTSDFDGPVVLEDRERLTLAVTFDPETAGLFSGDLVVTTSFAEEPAYTVALAGSAALAPDIDDPTAVAAALRVGETGEETFSFTNEGAGPLTWSLDGFAAARLIAAGRAMSATPDAGLRAETVLKGQKSTQAGSPVRFGAGGPDTFGYTWVDSNEPGGPAYAFEDISETGTAISLGDDDNLQVPLPFSFPFYDELYDEVAIVSNGFLDFGSASTAYSNAPIPSSGDPNGLLAVFWDDLNPSDGGSIYYADMEDGRFIVQWDGVPFYNTSSSLTFQAVLYADGRVLYQYEDLGDARSSDTIGIENPAGTDGLQVAYNTAYAESGLAVLIAPPARWIADADPVSGVLAPGATATVTLSLDAADLDPDLYEETLTVRSNDPDEPTKPVDVSLQVTASNAPAAPSLLLPEADATFRPEPGQFDVEVALAWEAVPDALSYDIEIATDAAFSEVVDQAEDFAGTSGVTEPLGIGTYFWHVRADGEEATGPWSPARSFVVAGGVANDEESGEVETALLGAFPNPVSRRATVRFALAQPADVALVVYDVLGKEVARLAEGAHPVGTHEALLSTDDLAPGVYLLRFAAADVQQTRQIVVVR
jgi:hypothetical protein